MNTMTIKNTTSNKHVQPAEVGSAASIFVSSWSVLYAAIFLFGSLAVGAEVPEKVRQEINAANVTYAQALLTRDVGAVTKIYTQDARLMQPGVDVLVGRSAIAEFYRELLRNDTNFLRIELQTVELEMAGKRAIETGKHTTFYTSGHTIRGNYLVVWKRENGKWKIDREIGNHYSVTPPSADADSSASPSAKTAEKETHTPSTGQSRK